MAQSATQDSQNPAPSEPPSEASAETPAKKKRPTGFIILGIVAVVGAIFAYRTYAFNQTHASTDDAYVRADIIPISPRVAGNIATILVKENQHVEKGQLLATLDDSTYRADLEQAEADLLAAKTGVQGAVANVGLTQATGNAQIEQAQGAVAQGTSNIESATVGVARAHSTVASAEAGVGAAQSQVVAAENAIRSQEAATQRAAQQAKAIQATVAAAEAAVRVARANVTSAEATAENAEREAVRARTLATEGALSGSVADQRATAAASARAAADAARQNLAASQANVAQQRANLLAARQAVKEAQGGIGQAKAQAAAARQNVTAQIAKVREAEAGVSAAQKAVEAAQAGQAQIIGRLKEAQTAPQKVTINTASQRTAEAKVVQAQAAVDRAKINLARTRLLAPVSGTVSQKTIEPGQQVTAGQPVMSVVSDELPWVVANFKETQLAGMTPGEQVEVEVDAIPGHPFHARIDSISHGTGATFALLPPDNATGNFTKVVQRVPVKIVFEPKQPNLNLLHAGLSANVVVSLKN